MIDNKIKWKADMETIGMVSIIMLSHNKVRFAE